MKSKTYPPGPKSKLFGSSYLDMYRDPLNFLLNEAPKYGDIMHMNLGPRHDYLINNPDHIKEILSANTQMVRSTARTLRRLLGNGLLTSDNNFHQRQRRWLQPAFHKQRIAEMGELMTDHAQKLSNSWEDGQAVAVDKVMLRLTLCIVVEALLGTDIEEEEHDIVEAFDIILDLTGSKSSPLLDEILWKLPIPRTVRFTKAKECLDKTIYKLIRKRREKHHDQFDLITLLLEISQSPEESGYLTDQQIRDEAMTMFIAGHETIASALTWTWYLLSEHSEAEAKMHQEIQSVLGEKTPAAEDLSRLPYTRMIFSESMRLYPPVWDIVRHPVEDYEIGGYTIPAGAYIHLSQFLMHRNPQYFPNPERFDPERWTPEAIAKRPKFSYFPFGGGKRQCIGEGFAWTEGLLVIITIAQKWRLKLQQGHPIALEPLITLRPKHGMPMTLEKRKLEEKPCQDNLTAKSH